VSFKVSGRKFGKQVVSHLTQWGKMVCDVWKKDGCTSTDCEDCEDENKEHCEEHRKPLHRCFFRRDHGFRFYFSPVAVVNLGLCSGQKMRRIKKMRRISISIDALYPYNSTKRRDN
jgi:hypothetical protein